MIDRSPVLHLVRDQHVPTIQEQHTKLFDGLVCHHRAQIIDEFVPSVEKRAMTDLLAREPRARRADPLEKADRFGLDFRRGRCVRSSKSSGSYCTITSSSHGGGIPAFVRWVCFPTSSACCLCPSRTTSPTGNEVRDSPLPVFGYLRKPDTLPPTISNHARTSKYRHFSAA